MEKRKEKLSTKRVCRFCLKNDEPLTSIFDRSIRAKNSVPLALQIMACVAIEVFPSDGMPSTICQICRFFMDQSYRFKQICKQGDEALRNFISHGEMQPPIPWPSDMLQNVPDEILAACSKTVSQISGDFDDDINIKLEPEEVQTKNHKKAVKIASLPAQMDVDNSFNTDVKEADEMFSEATKGKSIKLNVFSCDECDRSFPLKQLLELHQENHRRKRTHKCELCDKAFYSKYDLQKHFLVHSGEKPFQCVVCRKRFARDTLLRRHEKVHKTVPKFMCTECEMMFLTPDQLNKHTQKKHTGNKPFKCPECPKKFSFQQGCDRHVLTHLQRPFQCQYCPESFTSALPLQRHVQKHAGNRPYTCKFCPKTFLLSHHYTRHLRTKHLPEAELAKASNNASKRNKAASDNFKCIQCGETFEKQDDMIFHSAVHAIQDLTCPLCKEVFQDVDLVVSHVKSHIEGEQYVCEWCDLLFTSEEKLDLHMDIEHKNDNIKENLFKELSFLEGRMVDDSEELNMREEHGDEEEEEEDEKILFETNKEDTNQEMEEEEEEQEDMEYEDQNDYQQSDDYVAQNDEQTVSPNIITLGLPLPDNTPQPVTSPVINTSGEDVKPTYIELTTVQVPHMVLLPMGEGSPSSTSAVTAAVTSTPITTTTTSKASILLRAEEVKIKRKLAEEQKQRQKQLNTANVKVSPDQSCADPLKIDGDRDPCDGDVVVRHSMPEKPRTVVKEEKRANEADEDMIPDRKRGAAKEMEGSNKMKYHIGDSNQRIVLDNKQRISGSMDKIKIGDNFKKTEKEEKSKIEAGSKVKILSQKIIQLPIQVKKAFPQGTVLRKNVTKPQEEVSPKKGIAVANKSNVQAEKQTTSPAAELPSRNREKSLQMLERDIMELKKNAKAGNDRNINNSGTSRFIAKINKVSPRSNKDDFKTPSPKKHTGDTKSTHGNRDEDGKEREKEKDKDGVSRTKDGVHIYSTTKILKPIPIKPLSTPSSVKESSKSIATKAEAPPSVREPPGDGGDSPPRRSRRASKIKDYAAMIRGSDDEGDEDAELGDTDEDGDVDVNEQFLIHRSTPIVEKKTVTVTSTGKKRGRPRKYPLSQDSILEASPIPMFSKVNREEDAEEEVSSKRTKTEEIESPAAVTPQSGGHATVNQLHPTTGELPVKRGRGRPKKIVVPEETIPKEQQEKEISAVEVKADVKTSAVTTPHQKLTKNADVSSVKESPQSDGKTVMKLQKVDNNMIQAVRQGMQNVLMSPTGQTLKKVPAEMIKSLPPGVRPLPLPAKTGPRVVRVQKILMTKADVEAMTERGLVQIKDGAMVLKQGVKLPSNSIKSSVISTLPLSAVSSQSFSSPTPTEPSTSKPEETAPTGAHVQETSVDTSAVSTSAAETLDSMETTTEESQGD